MLFKTKERLALEEYVRRIKIREYQTQPEEWFTKRLGEDIKTLYWSHYPGYENHKWDGTVDPFQKVFEALANKEWCGVESATGVGKTFLLPRVMFWFLDTFPNSLVITTAPKKDQLRKVLWNEVANAYAKFKAIRPFSELLTLNLTVDGRSKTINMKKNAFGVLERDLSSVGHEAIGIVAGVGAGEESATKMQGFHRENMLFIVEEGAGVHQAVMTAIVNTCTAKNNLILVVGNPDNELDALHRFCTKERVRHIRISAYDHPNVVTKRVIISGAIEADNLEDRRKEYGEDSPIFKSRGRGIAPTEATDSLIKSLYFDQCCEGTDLFIKAGITIDTHCFNAVGVDVANSERGDMAALAWGERNMLTELQEFQCPNATHLAYNLIFDDLYLAQKDYSRYGTRKVPDNNMTANCIGVDGVGIGVATVNALYDNGYPCISLQGGQLAYAIRTGLQGEDLYSFVSLRAQMYYEAREDLRTGRLIISSKIHRRTVKQLKQELVVVKYKLQGGKIKVESKEEIKKRLGKSPNLADAFVYWNWMRKGYYSGSQHLPFG